MKLHAKLLIFLLFTSLSYAQEIDYKNIIKTLSSADFKGRGYVNKGELKAAKFIAEEFEKIHLKKFDTTYFQHFTTPVNTFPDDIYLEINNNKLISGKDYLVAPYSPSIQGTFDVTNITFEELTQREILRSKLKEAQGNILAIVKNKTTISKEKAKQCEEVIDFLVFHKELNLAACIVTSTDKLTWGTSTYTSARPKISINTTQKINHITIDLKNKFYEDYQTQNIIGYLEGTVKDTAIVVTAHYDHLGMMGKALFPGANDNASGIALLLETATYFSKQQQKPKYNLLFMAFGGEEAGLLGSKYYTEHPYSPLSQLKFLLNFDLAGTGSEGIKVVNATVYSKEYKLLQRINKQYGLLPTIQARGTACNSDHCFFYKKNVPGFYTYTLGGIKAYHDIYDKSETLPLTAFENYAKLIQNFIKFL